jgi:hypothetical protein
MRELVEERSSASSVDGISTIDSANQLFAAFANLLLQRCCLSSWIVQAERVRTGLHGNTTEAKPKSECQKQFTALALAPSAFL